MEKSKDKNVINFDEIIECESFAELRLNKNEMLILIGFLLKGAESCN